MNIVALDAQHYDHGVAGVGLLGFQDWTHGTAMWEKTVQAVGCGEYEPGAFFKRELPALMQALTYCPVAPDVIVVDAYVYLDALGRAGIGHHLWEQLGRKIPVIGVAKTRFVSADPAWEILRGQSKVPLFVTAIGCELEVAKSAILSMHGEHRMPTLLKRVDQLAREPLVVTSPEDSPEL